MNKKITEKNLAKEDLLHYTKNAEIADELYHRIGELEETISALDADIERATSLDAEIIVETLCATRNALNLERLKLEIEVHKLEIKMAEFETRRMKTR